MKSGVMIRQNLITYVTLLLICTIGIFYGNNLEKDFNFIRVWDFTNLAWLALGIPFLFLQSRAGLPNFWEQTVTNRKRLLNPFLIGSIFGIPDVLVIKVIMHPEPYLEHPPFLQPFPYSVFLYTSGAFEIEVFYRLIPLTIILLIGKDLKSGKFYNHFLWTGIILTSLIESQLSSFRMEI